MKLILFTLLTTLSLHASCSDKLSSLLTTIEDLNTAFYSKDMQSFCKNNDLAKIKALEALKPCRGYADGEKLINEMIRSHKENLKLCIDID